MPPVLTSKLLKRPGVSHGFFTRQGGVSAGCYQSLNVGVGSDDHPHAVAENRRRAAAWFGRPPERLVTAYQVHSAVALSADRPWEQRPEADGVATATSGLICGALTADCAPVLLADAEAGVVAACHAGWKGALTGIVASTVARMVELGAQPGRIVAAVGPCIGPESYEVGEDFAERFFAEAPGSQRYFGPGVTQDKRLFDLPGFVLGRLAEAGVERAEWVGADTLKDEGLFFSNRRAFLRGESDYGRLLSAIVLV